MRTFSRKPTKDVWSYFIWGKYIFYKKKNIELKYKETYII